MTSTSTIRDLLSRLQGRKSLDNESPDVQSRKKARVEQLEEKEEIEQLRATNKECIEAIHYLLGRLDQAETDQAQTADRYWRQIQDVISAQSKAGTSNSSNNSKSNNNNRPSNPIEPPQLAILRSADIDSETFRKAWTDFQPSILQWFRSVTSTTDSTSSSPVHHSLSPVSTSVEFVELASLSRQDEDIALEIVETPYQYTIVGSSETTSTTTVLTDVRSGSWSVTSTITCAAKLQLGAPSAITIHPQPVVQFTEFSAPKRGAVHASQLMAIDRLRTSKSPDCKVTAGFLRTCVGTRHERQVAFAIWWDDSRVEVFDTMGDWAGDAGIEAVERLFQPAMLANGSSEVVPRYVVNSRTTCGSHEDTGPAVVRIFAAIVAGHADVALGPFTRQHSYGLFKDVRQFIKDDLSLSKSIVNKIKAG